MTQEEFYEFHERNIVAFSRYTIRKLSAYAHRTCINSQKRMLSLETCLLQEFGEPETEDGYEIYGRTFTVRGESFVVRDEVMGECLQFIPPNKRSILLLSFFGEYSDCEIARLLGISNATVSYRKKDALRRLRVMMEAMDHEN